MVAAVFERKGFGGWELGGGVVDGEVRGVLGLWNRFRCGSEGNLNRDEVPLRVLHHCKRQLA